ncbi:unnamed protein product [Rotaria sordida]|uniref:Uncharacterized protein n=1 Tax=Rotaria sordida TaxID=392033 RepID=A0A815HHN4_9BILA|nr:unnamed protein product [Rotaria sordida]CAF1603818.1 unnamed protein product [Rotaria sordida]
MVARTHQHLNPHRDKFKYLFFTSIRMGRWEIESQKSGITDTMRINILSTINTSIDTRGSSNMFEIAQDVQKWLESTYGKGWTVVIYEIGHGRAALNYFDSKFLRIKETNLGWYITLFQQMP